MVNLDKFAQLISKNTIFHVLMEREVTETPFGQITFNFEIKDGVVDLTTLNIVRNCRRRYSGEDKSL